MKPENNPIINMNLCTRNKPKTYPKQTLIIAQSYPKQAPNNQHAEQAQVGGNRRTVSWPAKTEMLCPQMMGGRQRKRSAPGNQPTSSMWLKPSCFRGDVNKSNNWSLDYLDLLGWFESSIINHQQWQSTARSPIMMTSWSVITRRKETRISVNTSSWITWTMSVDYGPLRQYRHPPLSLPRLSQH